MSTTTTVIEPEVLPPLEAKLVKYSGTTGLEQQSTETLVEAFRPIFQEARQAIDDARGVAESVKDATCVREIMRSRACRLALRKIRLKSDETREKHKKHALLYGRAVDGFHNILMADLVPVETELKEAEEIAERAEARRLADLKAARESELAPFMDTPIIGDLSDLSEKAYQQMLSNAKLVRQAKLDAAAKLEADRKAKEEAERIERERIAADNARLKAEVEAREAAYKAEREATRLAVEKKLAEERAEAARVAAEIKAKADAAAKAAAEQAARERAEIEAKAKAEAARLAEIAAKEKAEADAKARQAAEEAAAARAALAAKEKAEAAERAKAESEAERKLEEAKKAAAAPDKAKLREFAKSVRALEMPTFASAEASAWLGNERDQFCKRVEDMASRL